MSGIANAANGAITAYEYDKADRVTNVIVSAIGLAEQSTKSVYDTMGRIVRTIEPNGTSKTNEYFATGLTKKRTGTGEYPVEFAYDNQGRMTNMTTWQNYATGAGAASTTWNFDAYRGFTTNKLYADGKGPGYSYDALGRLTNRKWARGTNTTYTYNDAGQVLNVIYSDNSTPNATNTYDRRGRLISTKEAGVTNTMSYNDAGLLTCETFGGMTVSNIYDCFLRRITNGILNSGGSWLTVLTNCYDSASRLRVVSDRTNSATYSYLATNRLIGEITYSQTGIQRMVTRKTYDGFYRLTSISHSNAPLGGFDSYRYGYNSANQRIIVTNQDNSRWAYNYDGLGQLTSGKKYWSDSMPVAGQQFEYTYDDIGNRKTAASGGDQWGTNLRYVNYEANNLNQYTARIVPDRVDVLGAANSNATVTVNLFPTYRRGEYFRGELPVDNSGAPAYVGLTNVGVLGNVTNDILTTNFGYALVPKQSESFTYDLDGNLMTDSLWTNTWNAENRLISVGSAVGLVTNGWMRETWSYRSDGRWNERLVWVWSGASYVPKYTNRFVWDGSLLLAIVDPANTISISFMRGLDLSGTRRAAGGVGGALAVTIVTNGVHFYCYDGSANVTALTCATNGAQSAAYEYDCYGNTLRASGMLAMANPLRFSMQFMDDVTTDIKWLFREQRPSSGRWQSKDPLGENDAPNVYAFVRNNSANFIDSNGRQSWAMSGPGWSYQYQNGKWTYVTSNPTTPALPPNTPVYTPLPQPGDPGATPDSPGPFYPTQPTDPYDMLTQTPDWFWHPQDEGTPCCCTPPASIVSIRRIDPPPTKYANDTWIVHFKIEVKLKDCYKDIAIIWWTCRRNDNSAGFIPEFSNGSAGDWVIGPNNDPLAWWTTYARVRWLSCENGIWTRKNTPMMSLRYARTLDGRLEQDNGYGTTR